MFGCRSQQSDFYYEKEWKEIKNLKVLTAFSRDQDDGSKQYVQHSIKQEGQYLSDLIVNKEAYIYVSGRAKFMPKSVEKAFIQIIKENSDEDPEEYIKSMKKKKRYQQEVW